ncbi:hypothetical protein [Siansivirga zeaxanthinifaciens]|uniref:hypothetical protein n=1 Tax=Siansivirga zeaxanthinifaciens TaxID=762954 RepID=UPI0012B5EC8D|nr:hypothetical protein [Siansivirga zeaxanthinifaciens]
MALIAVCIKSDLYVDEHNLAIQNELDTFDKNFKHIESIEIDSNFKTGSGHLYQ